MVQSRSKRWVLVAAASAVALSMAVPANSSHIFHHRASGSGTDGLGNRLTVLAVETFAGFGTGIAFVRLANESQTSLVFLNCVIFDERPGPGFHFMYSNGSTLSGRQFYIGVFDDSGPNRTGPYDVIYTQTSPVSGPCNVASVSSYPIGWDPVGSGSYVVD